jgi:hypothetical protein
MPSLSQGLQILGGTRFQSSLSSFQSIIPHRINMCTSTAAKNLLHTKNCNILVAELQREEPLLCHCQQVYSAQRPIQQPPKTEDKNNREEPETSPT